MLKTLEKFYYIHEGGVLVHVSHSCAIMCRDDDFKVFKFNFFVYVLGCLLMWRDTMTIATFTNENINWGGSLVVQSIIGMAAV